MCVSAQTDLFSVLVQFFNEGALTGMQSRNPSPEVHSAQAKPASEKPVCMCVFLPECVCLYHMGAYYF